MYPNLNQFQTYLRNVGQVQGFFTQKALFETLNDSLFDNLRAGTIFYQDIPLTQVQFQTLKDKQDIIIERAKQLRENYENEKLVERSFYEITPEEQRGNNIREAKIRFNEMDNNLKKYGL
jgi:hypothetical protein